MLVLLIVLTFVVNGCVLISAFASLRGIHDCITSSAVAIKYCAITKGM